MPDKIYTSDNNYSIMKKNQKTGSVSQIGLCLLFLGMSIVSYAQTEYKTFTGKEIVLAGSGTNDNCKVFEWFTDGGAIEYGEGTNSITLVYTTPGTKSPRLKYRLNGVLKNDLFTVTVYEKPTFDAILYKEICSGEAFQPEIPTIQGDYDPESLQWWLDGNAIQSGDVLTFADNGKFLQCSVETPVGKVYSDGLSIQVKDRPTILAIKGLPVSPVSQDEIHLSVDVNDNGSAITKYVWKVADNIVSEGSDELVYQVQAADRGKIVSIETTNGCGSTASTHRISSETIQTAVNKALPATVPVPESFIVADFDAEKDDHTLPDSYWTSKYNKFYTSRTNTYKVGSKVWFDYNKTRNGWVPSQTGYGSEFTVYKSPMYFDDISRDNNTTILLDYTDTYVIDVSTDENRVFQFFKNSDGFSSGCKIFGLKAVTNGVVDDSKKPTIIFNSPDVKNVLPTAMRIQSVANCVIENVKFDGNDRTFYNYGIIVIDGETGLQNNDYLIMKDINIARFKNTVIAARPRAVIAFIALNRRKTTDPLYVKNHRYVIDMKVESSCEAVEGSGTGINSALYVYGSDNIFFNRLTVAIGIDHFDDALIIGSGGYESELVDSRNVIFKDLVSAVDKIRLTNTYGHRHIVIPEKYRYYRFTPKANFSMEAFAVEPQFVDTAILYDRKIGYYIVPNTLATSNFEALRDMYKAYLDPKTGPETVKGCPLPNILLLMDSDHPTVEGFTVPDLGIGNVPVNIVAVDYNDYHLGAQQDPKKSWLYNSETPIVFEKANSDQKISLYNVDFSQSNYSIDDPLENTQSGSYYNCLINKHVESNSSLDQLTIETLLLALDKVDNGDVEISSVNNQLEISSAADPIQQVDCYDLQGRLIATKANINLPACTLTVPAANGVVIVKVRTATQTVARKLRVSD